MQPEPGLQGDALPQSQISLRQQVMAFTAARMVMNTLYRMVYPFLPVFARGLGVDLTTMALALTLRSLAGASGPLLAVVPDRRGRKIGMLMGLGMFTLGAVLVPLRPGFFTFVLAMLLTLMGKYMFEPSMQAYVGDRVSYARRGRVLAISEVGWSLSFMLGVPLMGLLIARFGWSAPFPVLAAAGFAMLLLLAWMLPEDHPNKGKKPGLLADFVMVLRHPAAVAGLLLSLNISLANEVINLVFGVWMEDSFGLKIAALGAASAIIGLSELSGEGFSAALVDRMGKTRAVAVGILLNSLAAFTLPLIGQSLAGALIGLFFFYITFEFTLVCSIPLMTEILPAARATLMSANITSIAIGRATGALIGPALYAAGLQMGPVFGMAGSAAAAVLFNLLALGALAYLRRRVAIE